MSTHTALVGRALRYVFAIFLLTVSIECFLGVSTALAAAPGPYISSVWPAADSQVSIETTTIGMNTQARAVSFTMNVDDSDGITSTASARTLVISGSQIGTVTLTPTLTYVAGSGETKAVLTTAHKNSALYVPEGFYTATLTVKDKTGVASTYTWHYFAAYTKPAVDFHTPPRDAIALLPTSKISANVSGPRSAITLATMKVDGVIVPATLTKSSNTVNTLEWTPTSPLAEGLHTVDISATNASGLSNTYSWTFTSSFPQPAFTNVVPSDGAQLVPDGSGGFNFSAFCQDPDGVDASSLVLNVTPPSGAPFRVIPSTTTWVGSSRRNVNVAAWIPQTATTGDIVVVASARDLLGNPAQRTFTYHLPIGPPVIDTLLPSAPPSTKNATVSACVRDTGSGVDTSTIQLRIDGALVTPQLAPVTGGYSVSYGGTWADNASHTASITVANRAGIRATATWSFTVHAAPVTTIVSPSANATWTREDVVIDASVVEPDDGVDASSVRVYFDGTRVGSSDVRLSAGTGAKSLDISATVKSVGGPGSIAHNATVVVDDTRGYETTTTWNFTVWPQTGQSDMAIDTNEPCSTAKCHNLAVDDFTKWNQLHWIVGDARGWGIPSTFAIHKYNCNICHYDVWNASSNSYTPSPVTVDGIRPCSLCHLVLGQDPTPKAPHGGNGNPYPYRFMDHEDSSTYAINTPSYGRDCLYCHQGKKGAEEVDTFANGTVTKAHDIVANHRVTLPSGCDECHSAVLTREHSVDRDADGKALQCDGCHGSSDPDVLATIKSYPALRFRFWGPDNASYDTWPVPSSSPPYSVETTAYTEVPGKQIKGGRVRLICSTLGTLVVEGQSGSGAWVTLWTKTLGGTSDGSPGGNGTIKPFPTYPSVTETFSCAPVDRVRIRYTPVAVGWHYVSANVDSWVIDGATPATCTDCHTGPIHPHPSTLNPSCTPCHNAELVTEHTSHTDDSGNALACATCHESTDPRVMLAINTGNTQCQACHLLDGTGHLAMHETALEDCVTCHNSNLLTEHVTVRKLACGNCHIQSAEGTHTPTPAAIQAVSFGMTACSDCHASAHSQRFAPSVPASIPLSPAFEWSPAVPTSTFANEAWMPSDCATAGARIVMSSRVATSAASVWSWYSANMATQGWTVVSGAPSGQFGDFTTRWSKPGQQVVIWCYQGEDHQSSTISPYGVRVEIAYYATE